MTTRTKKTSSKTSPKAQQQQRKFPVLWVAFGAIAVLLVAAIVFSGEESIGGAGEFGDVTINGESLPLMDNGAAVVANDPANGSTAPEANGIDFDGSAVAISHDGNPTAVVFLAHWCSHCQAEVPTVQAWLDSTGGVPGVDIVSVTSSANSGQPNWPPSDWLDRENWTTPNIRDDSDSSLFQAYGGRSFPYWVFLNGDGTVAHRQAGRIDIGQLQTIMQGLTG
jgi:thiol-disulfide isomerase/thioredoxin